LPASFRVYQIKEKLGSGGMSTVFRGVHAELGSSVAIKTLHRELAEDETFIRRFEREARALAAVRSHNIVSIIDHGEEQGAYFIVMEYVDGRDLRQILQQMRTTPPQPRPFPAQIALVIIEEVSYGLKAAHEKGIVHRDIKPGNVILDREGIVKIADFGLARDIGFMTRLTESDVSRPGTILGTSAYMSPEQAAGGQVDHRSDIFSLGVMVYELLSGEKPFKGRTETEVRERIINDSFTPLTLDRFPLLTPEIKALVERMLAKDPAKRHQNLDQVLHALGDCFESVDTTGGLSKNRRGIMMRFAQNPPQLADELRAEDAKAHLHRGFHYKSMGRESFGDASREFQYVLSLDAGHEKAIEALREIEESGLATPDGASRATVVDEARPERSFGNTLVIDPSARDSAGLSGKTTVAEEVPPAGRGVARLWGRRAPWLIPAAAGLALAVVAALWVAPKWQAERHRQSSAVRQESSRADSVRVSPPPPAPIIVPSPVPVPAPVPVPVPAPSPNVVGVLCLSIDSPELEYGVFVNGVNKFQAKGRAQIRAPSGEALDVNLRIADHFGVIPLGSYTLQPGQKRELGPVKVSAGTLEISCSWPFSGLLDGRPLPRLPAKRLDGVRVLEGWHDLEFACGDRAIKFVADYATRVHLTLQGRGEIGSRYRVEVKRGENLHLVIVAE
jgi:serine/threonine protein kinase